MFQAHIKSFLNAIFPIFRMLTQGSDWRAGRRHGNALVLENPNDFLVQPQVEAAVHCVLDHEQPLCLQRCGGDVRANG
jgi:hypothetical protein